MESACEGISDFLSSDNTPNPGLYFFFLISWAKYFVVFPIVTLHLKIQVLTMPKHLSSAPSLLLALPKDLVLSSVDSP